MVGAERLTSKQWSRDSLAGQLRARDVARDDGARLEHAKGGKNWVDPARRARGPARPPRGTAHAAGIPTPHAPRALACPCLWLLHVVCVTAGFPLPPSSDKERCLSPA